MPQIFCLKAKDNHLYTNFQNKSIYHKNFTKRHKWVQMPTQTIKKKKPNEKPTHNVTNKWKCNYWNAITLVTESIAVVCTSNCDVIKNIAWSHLLTKRFLHWWLYCRIQHYQQLCIYYFIVEYSTTNNCVFITLVSNTALPIVHWLYRKKRVKVS